MTAKELSDLAMIAGPIITILTAWFLIAKLLMPVIKKTKDLYNTWESFIRDWSGEEQSPGRDRIPGVMERLNQIDGQLKNNGGSSVKDAVDRIEIRINEIDDRLVEGDKKFDEIHNELKRIQKDLY
jgi:hypothetical protein